MERTKRASVREIAASRKDVFMIDPRVLKEKPDFNVRVRYDGIEELAASIAERGVEVPLQIFVEGENIYIKDGHRRHRAVMLLISRGEDFATLPCIVKQESDEDRIISLITCNSGTPLTMLEKGIVYDRLIRRGYNQSDIAKKIGTTPAAVSNALQLVRLPKKVQDILAERAIPDSTVLEALRCTDDEAKLIEVLTTAVSIGAEKGETRREVSRRVRSAVGSSKVTPTTRVKAVNDWLLENSIVKKDTREFSVLSVMVKYMKGELALEDFVNILGNGTVSTTDVLADTSVPEDNEEETPEPVAEAV